MTAHIAALPGPVGLDLLATLRRVAPESLRVWTPDGPREIPIEGTRRRWERVAHTLSTVQTLERVELLGDNGTLLAEWAPQAQYVPPVQAPPEERALALLLRAQDAALARQETSQKVLIDGFVRLAECASKASESQAQRATAAEQECARLRNEVARLQEALLRVKQQSGEAGQVGLTGDPELDGLVKDVIVAGVQGYIEKMAGDEDSTAT